MAFIEHGGASFVPLAWMIEERPGMADRLEAYKEEAREKARALKGE